MLQYLVLPLTQVTAVLVCHDYIYVHTLATMVACSITEYNSLALSRACYRDRVSQKECIALYIWHLVTFNNCTAIEQTKLATP